MAHCIDMTNNRANIAYTNGVVPWHGLGQALDPNADIDTWRKAAGMDWELLERPVFFQEEEKFDKTMNMVPYRTALVRSDTRKALAIVSDDYKVVQPGEVLEFFRDIVATGGFTLDVAGCLHGGRKYWALAKINESAEILGIDKVEGYILLATACDGTLATTAMFSSIRTVCQNTLNMSIREGESGAAKKYIKIPHRAVFDPDAVKVEMGLAKGSFEQFAKEAELTAKRKLSNKEAVEFLIKVMGDEKKPIEEQKNARLMKHVMELYMGKGMGSNLPSADGTLWGLINAVTEYSDHHRGTRTADSRLNKSWFGDGATMKQKAWDSAMKMVEVA